MDVIKSIPRGYCHGVVNALNLTAKTIKYNVDNKPIYILGEIVHNQKISEAFLEAGAITLSGGSREKLLASIDEGIVIITAHGVSPSIIEKAKKKGLEVIDATCVDVYKTHNVIKEHLLKGYNIIYIGKKNHPEPEGVLGIDKNICLVSNKEQIDNLNIDNDKILVTNQTTMSKYDVKGLFDYIKDKYPNAKILDEICFATSSRQEVAKKNSMLADVSFVVGDKFSNNTNKLVEICKTFSNKEAYRIDNINDIDINILLDEKIQKVHVTSGASTPTVITSEVISFIENFDKKDPATWDNNSKIKLNKIIPRIK